MGAPSETERAVQSARAELYGLPQAEFTAARSALARSLRDAGAREAAAEVARLPKPTVAAWAVNELARHQPEAVAELIEAGKALRGAQAQLLAGKADRTKLDEAVVRERSLTRQLAGTARGLLADAGRKPTEATLDRVRSTLHAVALDDELAERLTEQGGLEREQEALGIDALAGMPPAAGARAPSRSRAGEAERKARPSPSRRASIPRMSPAPARPSPRPERRSRTRARTCARRSASGEGPPRGQARSRRRRSRRGRGEEARDALERADASRRAASEALDELTDR